MSEEIFISKIDNFDPKRLGAQLGLSKVANFFLVLALIFNDIKDIIFFDIQTSGKYKNLSDNEKTIANSKLGEYSGRRIHTQKMLMGALSSFFKFLNRQKDVYETAGFQQIYKKLNRTEKDFWDSLIAQAEMTTSSEDPYQNILWDIRNKGNAHYEDLNLTESYINYFNNIEKNIGNREAFWANGNNYSETRFYFADGAMQQKFNDAINSRMTNDEFVEKNIEMITKIASSVSRLVREYIKQLPHV